MCFGTGDRVGLPGAGVRRRAGHVQLPASDKPGGERSRWAVAGNINAPGAVLSRGPIRRKVGFRPESNLLGNQNLTSRRECSRPSEPMAQSDSPATPGAPRAAAGGGVRMVQVPDDRAGQRLDNFLLGQLKGAPKSLVYKIVRSGQVRVNGGRAKADTRLEGGDEVRIPPVRLTEPGEKGVPAKGLPEAMEASIVLDRKRRRADRTRG